MATSFNFIRTFCDIGSKLFINKNLEKCAFHFDSAALTKPH